MSDITVSDIFDLSHTIASKLLESCKFPWEVLDKISDYIIKTGLELPTDEYKKIAENVWVSNSATISPTATAQGPCIIGHKAEIRHCAFIRGSAIIGESAVVGNSTEIKNAILFDCVQVPHYNYVGDSVLGYCAHLGAGAITSNVKGDKTPVVVKNKKDVYETGYKKFGAIVGDYAEIGCNSVLNPGVIIGRNTQVYPLSSVRGCVPSNSIYKKEGTIIKKR